MSSDIRKLKNAGFLFLGNLAFICSPIWGVSRFVNHDGSGHLYTSYVMLKILAGDDFFSRVFTFNSFAVPNSTGHWLMVALLALFSPVVVTKLVLTLTLALFAAAVVWLRYRTAGTENIYITILFAFAIGSNWLWMQGSYNYVLAAAASTFTLGLFFKWRNRMTVGRTVWLAVLFAFVFLSHLVSFALLVGSVFVLALFAAAGSRFRALALSALALVPIFPLLIVYRQLGQAGGGEPFVPAWRSLTSFSTSAMLKQLVWADPFVFISRKTLPFYDGSSGLLVVFSPVIWILVAAVLMGVVTYFMFRTDRRVFENKIGFIILAAAAAVGAAFGPDDFGLQNGSILRERVLIAALIFIVPLFSFGAARRLKTAVFCLLSFVLVFQAFGYWEYALDSNRESRPFFDAARSIPENSTVASVIVVRDAPRFHSMPSGQLINYIGIERNSIVWDNYELGHYMFPVVTANAADRKWVFEFTTSNVFYLNDPHENFEEKLSRLGAALSRGHQRLEFIIVYGADARLDELLKNWFDGQPVYESEALKVLRHR
jgi:hypothetical protein